MPSRKIVVTGAAGLVGQNLIPKLLAEADTEIVAIHKHAANVAILRRLHPDLRVVDADLAEPGAWEQELEGCTHLMIGHAQIGGLYPQEFVRNNVEASERLIETALRYRVGRGEHLVVGGELAGRRRLYGDQEGAGGDQPGLRHPAGCAAADAHVRLVRSQARRLAGPLHAEGAGLPDSGATAAFCASRSMPATSRPSSPRRCARGSPGRITSAASSASTTST